MDYDWIKAIHVAAVLVFTGGMLVQTLVLVSIRGRGELAEFSQRAAAAVISWDRKVTTPALLVVWAMGLWAGLAAGWFAAIWLWIKLLIVVALMAIQGIQAGRCGASPWERPLFRATFAGGRSPSCSPMRRSPLLPWSSRSCEGSSTVPSTEPSQRATA